MLEILILTAVAITGVLITTITDLRTYEMPDSITNFMIIFGIGAHIIFAISAQSLAPLGPLFIALAIIAPISLILFYSGQWGGGDAKLLIGITSLLPTAPKIFNTVQAYWPFPLTMIFNLFLLGGVYSILALFYYTTKNQKIINQTSPKLIPSIIGTTILAILSIPFNLFATVLLGFVLSFEIIMLAKIAQKQIFIKKIPVNKLTEGDWITKNLKIGNKLIYKVKKTGVALEDIKNIQKLYKKPVEIKTGIAFGPAFLLMLPITLYFGDLIFILLSEVLSKI